MITLFYRTIRSRQLMGCQPARTVGRCGGTVWPQGRGHRAYRDVFTACPGALSWRSGLPWARFCLVAGIALLTACGNAPEARQPPEAPASANAPLEQLQMQAVTAGQSPYLHWGDDAALYAGYDSHSNRFVPVYVIGNGSLWHYSGANSPYRDAERLRELYGYLPENTLNEKAVYLDQTNVFDLQRDALKAGVKHIFLVVFDGMDYSLLQLAMWVQNGEWTRQGAGDVFSFQTHRPPDAWQFGFAVTSPFGDTPFYDVDGQSIDQVIPSGGYNPQRGGATPWNRGEAAYLSGRDGHTVTDSAASAVAMTTGEKTYNGAINIGPGGEPLTTIAHLAQAKGYAVGAVSSVPFNHATTAAAYAHNVYRGDYQDLARDMLGLPSVSHPDQPLPGMDVVMGAGYGVQRQVAAQGSNYIPGNLYLAPPDASAINIDHGGRYIVARRMPGEAGADVLARVVDRALSLKARLFGFFGTRYAHLPYATADGDHEPTPGAGGEVEHYTRAELAENPTLARMTIAAIKVLAADPEGFWVMVESGDVDWAAHANNVDNAVGAIISGDEAVQHIIQWVETNSDWRESLLIVTADHGHLLYVDDPAGLSRIMQ